MLAAVFANQGDYATSTSFTPALTIGAATVALGALAALLIPGRRAARSALEPALAAA